MLAILLTALSAVVPPDLAALQGTWTLVSYRVDGKTLRGADPATTFTVEADRWASTWRKDGTDQVEQGEVRLISTKGKPKVADLVHTFGPYKGTTTRILYQVDGELFRYTSIVASDPVTPEGAVVTSTLTWKRKVPRR